MRAFLSDPGKASAVGARAYGVFADNRGALKNTLAIMKDYMEKHPEQKQVAAQSPTRTIQPPVSIRP
jgi:hypothetical protein